jgi:hypothetical protein
MEGGVKAADWEVRGRRPVGRKDTTDFRKGDTGGGPVGLQSAKATGGKQKESKVRDPWDVGEETLEYCTVMDSV